jgi:hypothetical protein
MMRYLYTAITVLSYRTNYGVFHAPHHWNINTPYFQLDPRHIQVPYVRSCMKKQTNSYSTKELLATKLLTELAPIELVSTNSTSLSPKSYSPVATLDPLL